MNFEKGECSVWSAKQIRAKLGIDLGKQTLDRKREWNLRNIKEMENHVNKLHKVKNLDYYNK